MTFTFASTFTGIGGFECGFMRHGATPTCLVEWDRNCQTVLGQHFPGVPLMGDIHDVRGTDIGRPDLVVGGFPCQDTSIAAPHRRGLEGKRSANYFEFQRLIGEHLRLVDSTRPRWVAIENPVGLLASPGRGKDGTDRTGWDMAACVRGLEDLGYGWSYRVVDGRHFGSPQRRERVILVGHRGGDPRPAALVLGLVGAGGETPDTSGVRRRSRGPQALPRATDDSGTLIFRKSARARKAISAGGYETWVPTEDDGNTLTGYDGGGPLRQTHLVVQDGRVRTLTLTEWERLQGFPDGWTAAMPTSARYTALGNAMNVGMADWLGGRLAAVHAAIPQIDPAAATLAAV